MNHLNPDKLVALNDLKAKVSHFLKDVEKIARERIEKVEMGGGGIISDHMKNNLSFITPRDFMAAFGEELGRQCSSLNHKDKQRESDIARYKLYI